MYFGSISKKYVRKPNHLVCKEFVKNIVVIYSLNELLLSLTLCVAFAPCLLNRFVVFRFTLWILNGFICCRYYTQSIVMVVAGASTTLQDRLSALRIGHRDHTRESRIHKELQSGQHHNHIYNNTFINVHNSTSKYNVSEYKPRTQPYSI